MDKGGHVRSVLEKANCRDPGGTAGETGGGVRQRNSADRQHRDGHGAANFRKPLKSLRRTERRFRRRGEDGAEKEIVRATARGGFRSPQRVAEIGRASCRERV